MSSISRAVSLPLFDRLSVKERAVPRSRSGTLGLDDIERSVQRDLERLLSCRSRLGFDAFSSNAESVLDYGIPDSSTLTMTSLDDRARLGAAIARAIALFEPRLRDVNVTVEPFPTNNVDALVQINGTLSTGDARHRAAFSMTRTGTPMPSGGPPPRSGVAFAKDDTGRIAASGAGR